MGKGPILNTSIPELIICAYPAAPLNAQPYLTGVKIGIPIIYMNPEKIFI